MKFCALYKQEETIEGVLLRERTEIERVFAIGAYLHWGLTEERLQASTVLSSLSGVMYMFNVYLTSTSVFQHSAVKAMKGGVRVLQRQSGVKVSAKKYPVTLDMMLFALKEAREKKDKYSIMRAIAMMTAFFCMFRASEYIPDNKRPVEERTDHAIRAKHVQFRVVKHGVDSEVDASRLGWWDVKYVTRVKITLPSAKNDQDGEGSNFWFNRLEDGVDIVGLLAEWAATAKLQAECYFFSFLDERTKSYVQLDYNDVLKGVKRVAVAFGFNPLKYGTHSMRIGGACALRHGGAPDSMIQLLGRWKSASSCLNYQSACLREFDNLQAILSDRSIFTVEHVKLIHEKLHVSKVVVSEERRVAFAVIEQDCV